MVDYPEPNNRINLPSINSAVVIPALNPGHNLINLVNELLNYGIPQIIVVNDGSESTYNSVFQALEQIKNCTVLTHKVNCGKGRALKTAFLYFIDHYPNLDGVVTADADGQHAAEDICNIAEKLSIYKNSIILGVRNFQEDNVPERSYIGNTVTSRVFWFLYGYYLSDTQTGLRGIPTSELSWITELKGERYDYEINMLIYSRFRNIPLHLVPIKTLYIDNNSGSHYKAIRDSFRIFRCLVYGILKQMLAAIFCGILDLFVFFVLYSTVFAGFQALARIFACAAIARLLSAACKYIISRSTFIAGIGKLKYTLFRYYILLLVMTVFSCGLIYLASLFSHINIVIIKLIVDFILGFISYHIHLRWISNKKYSSGPLASKSENNGFNSSV
ncbi:MAG TPA: glycosyltransferase family 2 protein [Clostridiaceae bacterium]|nr:glycosyltransferase family 2 protein [Clostridiaceae bacterium]